MNGNSGTVVKLRKLELYILEWGGLGTRFWHILGSPNMVERGILRKRKTNE